MLWYFLAVTLHILAVVLWIGLVSYWVLAVQPFGRRVGSPAGNRIVEATAARVGGIGWLCLAIALLTGVFLVCSQGATWADATSGELFQGRFGEVLHVKVVLVALLVALQLLFRRSSGTVGWLFLVVGLAVVGMSTFLIR